MRKLFVFAMLVFLMFPTAFAVNPITPKSKAPLAAELQLPLFGTSQTISVAEYLKLTPKEYKRLTGKKMNLKDKIGLKLSQRQLKKAMNKDGTINIEKLKKVDTSGFNIGGFVLGLFLSIIGVLIAYLISNGEQPNLVKWAWIGAAVGLVLILLFSIL